MNILSSIALVTGSSKGIGRATALMLTKNGASVIINYSHDKIAAEATLHECNKFSQGNVIFKADITNQGELIELGKFIKNTFGKLDILVNNAGIFDGTDRLRSLTSFENVFNHNFFGQIRVTNMVLPYMTKGKIVNVSSIHGRLGTIRKDAPAYVASKAALNSYTKNLASALAPNILVNAVAPGKTYTPMWGGLSLEEQNQIGEDQLIGRMIEPEEVADAIEFLIKNDAMVGEILVIDGGLSLKVLG